MSKFDYQDPGTDPAYCDRISAEPGEDVRFQCLFCGSWTEEETYWPLCSPECVASTDRENREEGAA